MGRLREYTRIKHTVLMDIFAGGLLSKREMQVALVVIRESWGWDHGTSNWTKRAFSQRQIADITKIDSRHLTQIIQNMLERKILDKDEEGRYSFNEHPDTWLKIVTKKVTSDSHQKGDIESPKRGLLVTKKVTSRSKKVTIRCLSPIAFSNNLKDLRQLTKLPKERFKERFKETLKEMVSFLRNYYQIKIKKLRTFDKTRVSMIHARLENFSLRELMTVVDNISKSDWNMGKHPKTHSRPPNSFELLFRNDRQVEEYLALKPQDKKITWRDKEWKSQSSNA